MTSTPGLTPSLADLDPATLPAATKRALRLASSARMIRRPGGWIGASGKRVSKAVAAQAVRHGLLRVDASGRYLQLALTGAGRTVLAVLDERQAARSARLTGRRG